jgi:hypothetical protein
MPFRPREETFTTFSWADTDNLLDVFESAGDAIAEYGRKLKNMTPNERHDFTLINLPKLVRVRELMEAAYDGYGMITHRYSHAAQMIKNVFGWQYEPAFFEKYKKKVSSGGVV